MTKFKKLLLCVLVMIMVGLMTYFFTSCFSSESSNPVYKDVDFTQIPVGSALRMDNENSYYVILERDDINREYTMYYHSNGNTTFKVKFHNMPKIFNKIKYMNNNGSDYYVLINKEIEVSVPAEDEEEKEEEETNDDW